MLAAIISAACFLVLLNDSSKYLNIQIHSNISRVAICAIGLLAFGYCSIDRLNQTYGIEGLEEFRTENEHDKHYTIHMRNKVVKEQPKSLREKKND